MNDQVGDARIGGRYRSWLVGAGVLLAAVSGVYLVLYAVQHEAELRSARLSLSDLPWAAAACALYCGALLFSALGWLSALRAFGGTTHGPLAVGISLVSQIGKYVPGNLAQHIGRVVFATSRGIPLKLVMQSTVFELVSAVFAGVAVVTVTGALSFHRADPVIVSLAANAPTMAAVVAGLGLLACGAVLAPRLIGRAGAVSLKVPQAAATLLAQMASVTAAGLSFCAVVEVFAVAEVSLLYCVALFSVAWLAGFVTPGAPAGLGVRETILLLGLSGVLGPMSLPAALMHRLVTAIADGLMAVVGAIVMRSPMAGQAAAARPSRD